MCYSKTETTYIWVNRQILWSFKADICSKNKIYGRRTSIIILHKYIYLSVSLVGLASWRTIGVSQIFPSSPRRIKNEINFMHATERSDSDFQQAEFCFDQRHHQLVHRSRCLCFELRNSSTQAILFRDNVPEKFRLSL